jgi:hypothetical protein
VKARNLILYYKGERHMKKIIMIVVLGLFCSLVCADVATPRPQWTKVRMASEEVTITLSETKVKVEAVFNMHNTGEASKVRFGYPLGLFEKKLNDFKVFVGDEQVTDVKTQKQTEKKRPSMMIGRGGKQKNSVQAEPYRFGGPYKEWKVFDVAFSSDEKKVVKVTYWVEPASLKDEEKGDVLFYSYILKTGATWKGKIDTAVLKVKLDGVSPKKIVQALPKGAVKSKNGTVLTWMLKDIKPDKDIEITFKPSKKVVRK